MKFLPKKWVQYLVWLCKCNFVTIQASSFCKTFFMCNTVLCLTWNFEKVMLLKLTDKVSFHLNISSTMQNLQTRISFRSNRRKMCLCYLLFYLLWWPRCLISKQHFRWFLLNYLEYSHQISPQKSEKYDLTFGTKITVGLEKIGGMMLWIMSGTSKLFKIDELWFYKAVILI